MSAAEEIKLENLVVLMYRTPAYTDVLELKDAMEYKNENLKIDLNKNTWSYLSWKNMKIGEPRNLKDNYGVRYRNGIIGVYDRMNTKHLAVMTDNSQQFTSPEDYAKDTPVKDT